MNLKAFEEEIEGRGRACREATAEITAGGRFLETSDRDLVRTVFEHGVPPARVAQVMGKPSYHVVRRLKRLVRRLRDPLSQFVISQHSCWPELRRGVGICIFVRGTSQRNTALQLGVTVHRVRKELQFIRAMYESEHAHALHRSRRGEFHDS